MAGDIFGFHPWWVWMEAQDWLSVVRSQKPGMLVNTGHHPTMKRTAPTTQNNPVQSVNSAKVETLVKAQHSTDKQLLVLNPVLERPFPPLSGQCILSGKDQGPLFLILLLQREKVECRTLHLASLISGSSCPLCSPHAAVLPGSQAQSRDAQDRCAS